MREQLIAAARRRKIDVVLLWRLKIGNQWLAALVPVEPDLEIDNKDDLEEEDPWLDNPVMGAKKLLRFFRVQQLPSGVGGLCRPWPEGLSLACAFRRKLTMQ